MSKTGPGQEPGLSSKSDFDQYLFTVKSWNFENLSWKMNAVYLNWPMWSLVYISTAAAVAILVNFNFNGC